MHNKLCMRDNRYDSHTSFHNIGRDAMTCITELSAVTFLTYLLMYSVAGDAAHLSAAFHTNTC